MFPLQPVIGLLTLYSFLFTFVRVFPRFQTFLRVFRPNRRFFAVGLDICPLE